MLTPAVEMMRPLPPALATANSAIAIANRWERALTL
jgi:hypothetical protein